MALGKFPRGKAKAPKHVKPPEVIEKEALVKQIKDAKQTYRKFYQKRYRELYNKIRIQITFRVSKQEFRELEIFAKQKGIKVTALAKERTLKISKSNNIEVKIQLSELIDSIEEAIYKKGVIDPTNILNKLETIEEKL